MELAELRNLHSKGLEVFDEMYQDGLKNADLLRAKHWTDLEKKKHEEQGLNAWSVALFEAKFTRILSEQRSNRSKFKVRARGVEDEIIAEIGNYVLDYIDDRNKFKYVESDIYKDGLGKKWGVLHARIDTSVNPRGEVTIEDVPFNEVMWDNNNTKYSLEEGCTWFERFGWFTREQISQLIGVPLETLNKVPSETPDNKEDWSRNTKGKELIKVVWHYEKIQATVYKVKNLLDDTFYVTKSKDEADKFIAEQKKSVKMALELGGVGRPSKEQDSILNDEIKVLKTKDTFWELTVFSGSEILKPSKNIGRKLPYVVFFSFIDDGRPFCLTDIVRDPQRMFDRYMSMIDKSTVKNIKGNNYIIYPDLLHPNQVKDPTKLMNELSAGGKVIQGVSPDRPPIQAVDKYNDVKVELGMLNATQSYLEDLMGGRTFQGLEASHRQTATEAQLMEQSAKIGVMLYHDNLIRWKMLVGELLWYLAGETYKGGRQFRIMGEDLSKEIMGLLQKQGIYEPSMVDMGAGYINYTDELKPLKDTKVDIIVDTELDTREAKDRKFASILAWNDMMLQRGYPPLPAEVLIKYAPLDATDKNRIVEYLEQQAKAREQAQLEEQKQRSIDNAVQIASAIGEPTEQNGNPLGV